MSMWNEFTGQPIVTETARIPWNPSLHPRLSDGRFTGKAGGWGGSPTSLAPEETNQIESILDNEEHAIGEDLRYAEGAERRKLIADYERIGRIKSKLKGGEENLTRSEVKLLDDLLQDEEDALRDNFPNTMGDLKNQLERIPAIKSKLRRRSS